jgi:hypothetical protein
VIAEAPRLPQSCLSASTSHSAVTFPFPCLLWRVGCHLWCVQFGLSRNETQKAVDSFIEHTKAYDPLQVARAIVLSHVFPVAVFLLVRAVHLRPSQCPFRLPHLPCTPAPVPPPSTSSSLGLACTPTPQPTAAGDTWSLYPAV